MMGYCKNDGRNAKIMAKECKEVNSCAKKVLEEAQTRYEKLANKFRREIQFEVGDFVMLNIHDFKMLEALVACFIPKYSGPYRVTHKPHLNTLLATTFVAHLTFHVSKLKPFKVDDKRLERKHEYHKGFNLMEHQLVVEIECILSEKQTRRCGKQYIIKWKRCHPKETQWVMSSLIFENYFLNAIAFIWINGHQLSTSVVGLCLKLI
jgi:hypothetical protein